MYKGFNGWARINHFLIMYDKLITPEEKRLLESNRQLPNETGDEYKARMARKEANKKSSKLSK